MWCSGEVRASASPPGALGESAAVQRAASGAARSRAAGRLRERGAPGILGAELRASSGRQHEAVTLHRLAGSSAGRAGGREAGCALADGSLAGARVQGKMLRMPTVPASRPPGQKGLRAARCSRARSTNFALRLQRPPARVGRTGDLVVRLDGAPGAAPW